MKKKDIDNFIAEHSDIWICNATGEQHNWVITSHWKEQASGNCESCGEGFLCVIDSDTLQRKWAQKNE